MKPSYKNSTLSLAFILSLASVFLLIIVAIVVAFVSPEAYNLASGDKLLVMVLLVSYIGFVSNIIGAYLGSRKVDTKTEQQHSETTENEKQVVDFEKPDIHNGGWLDWEIW